MTVFGATVAIFANKHVLLTKRDDWAVWCLPGGGLEVGESFAQAAIREAFEETGLHIQIDWLDWRIFASALEWQKVGRMKDEG